MPGYPNPNSYIIGGYQLATPDSYVHNHKGGIYLVCVVAIEKFPVICEEMLCGKLKV